jgi:hypothetical protein
VKDPALAAGHRAEVERRMRLLDTFRGRERAQAQLFDAQHSIVIRVEAEQGVILPRHPEHFHGDLFESEQQFRLVRQQEIQIRAGEFDPNIGVLKIGMRRGPVRNLKRQADSGFRKNSF